MSIPEQFVGNWRITQMAAWDQDFVDLVALGHFTIRRDGMGSFLFGAVQGEMDCRPEKAQSCVRLVFTWSGSDECDPAAGRGWMEVVENEMTGNIVFHLGDESEFHAERATAL